MHSPSVSTESDTSELPKSNSELPSLAQTLPLCHQTDLTYRSSFASTLHFPAADEDLPESGKRELVIKRIPEESQMARRHLGKLLSRLQREAEGVRRNTKTDVRIIEEGRRTLRHANERLDVLLRDCQSLHDSLTALSAESTQREQHHQLQSLEARVKHLCALEKRDESASCACSVM